LQFQQDNLHFRITFESVSHDYDCHTNLPASLKLKAVCIDTVWSVSSQQTRGWRSVASPAETIDRIASGLKPTGCHFWRR